MTICSYRIVQLFVFLTFFYVLVVVRVLCSDVFIAVDDYYITCSRFWRASLSSSCYRLFSSCDVHIVCVTLVCSSVSWVLSPCLPCVFLRVSSNDERIMCTFLYLAESVL